MRGEYFSYGLLAGLAIALLIAAFTDLRTRKISNKLCLAVALGAPLFWWATGLSLWPGVPLELATATGCFAFCCVFFALGWMGGGDVKLLTALALWFPPLDFLQMFTVIALLGGVLTLAFGAWHIARRQKDKVAIPYGISIAAGGLWSIAILVLPAFRMTGQAG
jgi:prepilin peptidase CpaA